ncbi:D-amino acid aminotransferase [Chitinibacteraceae bacterium HSL-7]
MNCPDTLAFLDGRYAPLAELSIPVLDRGFLFGDGAYEMIPVYGRTPFRLDDHLTRLDRTLAAIGIANPYDLAAWHTVIARIIDAQTYDNQSIYLQVTRGAAWPRNHAFPRGGTPTTLVFADRLDPPPAELVEHGVSAITLPDIRWGRCDLKVTSLLANVLAKQAAVDAGCAETIMLRDGWLTEGAASNLFIVADGVILTPPPSHQMLTGITYDVVLELAGQHALPLQQRAVSEQELRTASEIWLTSSSKEILAIVTLDGAMVGNGQPGPIYRKMYAFYQEAAAARQSA